LTMFFKAAFVAAISLGSVALANLTPDGDPCRPPGPYSYESRYEYDERRNLDDQRCRNPCNPPGPWRGESRRDYDERNNIDRQRCNGRGNWGPRPVWFEPQPIVIPVPVGVPVGGFGGPGRVEPFREPPRGPGPDPRRPEPHREPGRRPPRY